MDSTGTRRQNAYSISLYRRLLVVLFWGMLLLLMLRDPAKTAQANHSHFRFGHINWVQDASGPFVARITYTAGFRRSSFSCFEPISGTVILCSELDGLPGIGDVFAETVGGTHINDFGDGSSTDTLYFKVFAFDAEDDWVMARALEPGTATQEYLLHTYLGVGPYTVISADCCRTLIANGTNAHVNNPNKNYSVEAVINFQTTASPVSLLPPVVDCPMNSVCEFTVAAVDPDAFDPEDPQLNWRLATPVEMGGANLLQPPGATVDPETGVYSWDTTGVALGGEGFNTLYSTQVVIEDLDGNNNPISKVAIDFFIRIVELPGPPAGFLQIPVRWCVLSGSPTDIEPEIANDYQLMDTDTVLSHRLKVLTLGIYRQANIGFFSALRNGANVPIIIGPDQDGHIPPSYSINRDRVVNACRLAWRDLDPAATGMIAVNVNRFVDENGIPTNALWGIARIPDIRVDVGDQILQGVATVIDNAYFVGNPDPGLPGPLPGVVDINQKWLGHELGHGLSLRHPPQETFPIPNPSINLMDDQTTSAIEIIIDQEDVIRLQANLIPDVRIGVSPGGTASITNLPSGSTWPDTMSDVPAGEEFVDLDTMALVVDLDQAITHLVASTFGLFPENIADVNFYFLVDLDNDPDTGGAPASIGVPGTYQGIEMVGLAQVNVVNGVAQGVPTVWQFQNGQYIQISDPSIQVSVTTMESIASPSTGNAVPVPDGQIVQLLLSNDVRGPIADEVPLVTVVENTVTGTVDGVEGDVFMVPPIYPSCQVDPDGVLLGSSATLTATDLPPNSPVNVWLGTQIVTTGTTDATGNASIGFVVPENVGTGTFLVYVQVVDSGTEAGCPVQLWANPAFDMPPSPPDGSSFNVNAGETVTFSVQASDLDVETGDVVALSVLNLPPGGNFPIPVPANPASSTFSWTPTESQVGSYVIVFTAQDSLGLEAQPLSVVITVQPGGPSNLIFADDFESGDFSAWYTYTITNSLSVTTTAALTNTYGLAVHVNNTGPFYTEDDSPNAEMSYRARLLFDPNSTAITADRHTIFQAYKYNGSQVFRLEIGKSGSDYLIYAVARLDDFTRLSSTAQFINDDVHTLEVEWRAASSAAVHDGVLRLWIDGVLEYEFADLDNDNLRVDSVRIGYDRSPSDKIDGTYCLDYFESHTQSYMGPVPGATACNAALRPKSAPRAPEITAQGDQESPVTNPVGELIFADGFESGDASAWTLYDSDGDVQISTAGALTGTYGMAVEVNDVEPAFVRDGSPNNESSYEARFYFDPNGLALNSGNFTIFRLRGLGDPAVLVVDLGYGPGDEYYQLEVSVQEDDGEWVFYPVSLVTDGPHSVEISWGAASESGVEDGWLRYWIDGELAFEDLAVNNGDQRVTAAELGVRNVPDITSQGVICFDEFASASEGYFGEVPGVHGCSIQTETNQSGDRKIWESPEAESLRTESY